MLGWNVDSRLSAITVDNCSTNDSMIGKTALAYKKVFPRLKLFGSHYVLVPSEVE